jgi:hypothetical protein
VARYYALREIERLLHQPRAEHIEILSALSIEHVMPEEWMEQWLLPNGNRGVTLFERFDDSRATEDVEATEKRDRAKHTIGNLTLLTQPLNSSVSNSAFEIKKPEIVRNSALALNRYFHEPECWDETNITERGEALFAHAFRRWPYPHSTRHEYVHWARDVAKGLRGVNQPLEDQFDEAAAAAERSFKPGI